MTRTSAALFASAGLAAGASACAQPGSVVNGPHNLSATGPGTIRASMEDEVCIFCHTPHNAAPIRPLWNRSTPPDAYQIYTSRSLDATPGQPTGPSKMCLSCHDGTIALGSVLSRATPIMMAGGVTTMPAGASNLGTDLRDDHPISFRFDHALASRDPKLKSPAGLPEELKLDRNSELQCTTCHDAHNNSRGKFLVLSNANSQLCISCHQVGSTQVAEHQDCSACHQPHSAPSGPYLMRKETVTKTCLACHDGTSPHAMDVASDLRKLSTHDTNPAPDAPGTFGPELRTQTSCTDCHEPHTMGHGTAQAPGLHPSLGRIDGVSTSGGALQAAHSEYEVCFKCHADRASTQPAVSRRIVQNNTRLELASSAISFHPVMAPGKNQDVPSLRPGWNTASVMHCSDCHSSDSGAVGTGSGGKGTHGSNTEHLLAARYQTADLTSESAASYALCYACHDRSNLLSDESFPHRLHVVDQRTSCAACHDAHGIASSQGSSSHNSHLINFQSDVVFPDPATGRLEFNDTGRFSGECFLRCHGVTHAPARYPANQLGLPSGLIPR